MAEREREARELKPADNAASERACRRVIAGMEYSWWAGMCLEEVIKANPRLPEERKAELLKLCPRGRRKEGKELLEMLPAVARSLAPKAKRKQ